MPTVLAAIDTAPSAHAVLEFAEHLAGLLGAGVRRVHVSDSPESSRVMTARHAPLEIVSGDPVSEIVRAVTEPGILMAVVGARGASTGRRPAGRTAVGIVERASKPVAVVPPPRDVARRAEVRRILVPLEGTAETTGGVAEMLDALVGAGVSVVALHVFDAATVPSFWGDTAHSLDGYTAAFRDRWCTAPDAEVLLRRGPAPDLIARTAAEEDVDLVVLGWGRDLAPGHAEVVRTVLSEVDIPVLLVPTR